LSVARTEPTTDPEPREECGVFGAWAPGEDVAKLAYYGLYALQHRGQEAAGIAVSDGRRMVVFKELGLVSQVFDEQTLSSLKGHLAVGHCRYSTTGSTTWENAAAHLPHHRHRQRPGAGPQRQPRQHRRAARRGRRPGSARPSTGIAASTDSDLVAELMASSAADIGVEEAAVRLLPRLRGAFSLVFADEQTLYAARDRHGVRPLVLGRLERGWVVASETAALDIVGASFVREVEPGELLAIDADGIRSSRFAAPEPKGCVFEYVYLARPDTTISGRSVHAARVEIGRRLAEEHPVEADLVIPVPESGTPAAIGYAQGSGIPYGQGLVKNAYVGRTFIQPSQTIRQLGIRLKLNPLRDVIRGKRLVVVDDSIVAATPSARWSGCCARPGRWRCTRGSPRRRCAGRASTASTSPAAPSWWPAPSRWRACAAPSGPTRWATSPSTVSSRPASSRAPGSAPPASTASTPIALPEEARLGKHLLEAAGMPGVPGPDVPRPDVSGAASGDPGPIAVGYGAAGALDRP
jgi:amidophosphoribosyltransferase